MFKHSVKVPRLYKVAAKVAKDVKEGLGSIKQLVYENRSKHPNIKAIYALVATLFQRSDEIENLLKRSQFLVKEPRSDPWLTKILIVELLWGKKCLPGQSKPETTVLAYEQIFKAHISDVPQISNELESNNTEEFKPRYVRVNTLYMTLNDAVEGFREEGWVLNKCLDKTDYKGFLDKITSLADEEFLVDIHIPNLLIFPPKTHFYNHPAYKNGSIILQDKASCLPVHILGPPPGSTVLDMCSAPGMKTTQVAAAINNEGKVYAVERDPRRFETLNRIIESSGATCVTTVNKDVLTCAQKDFPGVEYILVDPSCSGSGITGRHEFEQQKSNQRIEKLAGFQIKILRSALTRYPDAKRVVYSTCSVFPEENEDVVRQVLETNSKFKLVPATKFVNNTWKNFGSSEYGDIGSYCLYAKPNDDFTNGFFVAVFEKLEEGEQNQFFNTKIYNFKKHMQNQEKRKRKQQNEQNFENFKESVEEDPHNFENTAITIKDNETENNYNTSFEISNREVHNDVNRKRKKNKSKADRTFETNTIKVLPSEQDFEKDEAGVVEGDVKIQCSVKKRKKKNNVDENFEGNYYNQSESSIDNNIVIKKEKKKLKSIDEKNIKIEIPNDKVINIEEETDKNRKEKRKKKKSPTLDNEQSEIYISCHKAISIEENYEDCKSVIKKEKKRKSTSVDDGHREINNDSSEEVRKDGKKRKSTSDKRLENVSFVEIIKKEGEGTNNKNRSKKVRKMNSTFVDSGNFESENNVLDKAIKKEKISGNEVPESGKPKKKKRKDVSQNNDTVEFVDEDKVKKNKKTKKLEVNKCVDTNAQIKTEGNYDVCQIKDEYKTDRKKKDVNRNE